MAQIAEFEATTLASAIWTPWNLANIIGVKVASAAYTIKSGFIKQVHEPGRITTAKDFDLYQLLW